MLDILVILDRSGSMSDRKNDHEGGLRAFVEDQKNAPGEARFTFVQFDTHDPCEVIYDRVPLSAVKEIKLIPRGGTPLLDAIGKSIAHLEGRRGTPGPDDDVVCMVVTDGQENESRAWTRDRVRQRIEELEKNNWTFLFLGANLDAFAEAQSLGMAGAAAMSFNAAAAQPVADAYFASAQNMRGYRSMRSRGISAAASKSSLSYTADQRSAAMNTAAVRAAMTSDAAPRGIGAPLSQTPDPITGAAADDTDQEKP